MNDCTNNNMSQSPVTANGLLQHITVTMQDSMHDALLPFVDKINECTTRDVAVRMVLCGMPEYKALLLENKQLKENSYHQGPINIKIDNSEAIMTRAEVEDLRVAYNIPFMSNSVCDMRLPSPPAQPVAPSLLPGGSQENKPLLVKLEALSEEFSFAFASPATRLTYGFCVSMHKTLMELIEEHKSAPTSPEAVPVPESVSYSGDEDTSIEKESEDSASENEDQVSVEISIENRNSLAEADEVSMITTELDEEPVELEDDHQIDSQIEDLVEHLVDVIVEAQDKVEVEEEDDNSWMAAEVAAITADLAANMMEEEEVVEEEEEEDGTIKDEEEEDLFVIEMEEEDGSTLEYLTNNELTGDIYELINGEEPGKIIGKFVNGDPEFFI